MQSELARWCRKHPLLTACLLVAAGTAVGYTAAGLTSGKLRDTLIVASTTLIFGALLGGAVKFLLEDLQRLRERREQDARFVRQVLDDLKSVYDRVERVRILIAAHRSALTYGNEMRDLIEAAVQLRNVTRALDRTSDVLADRETLKRAVAQMTVYLDSLTSEFKENYKQISDKQAVYELQAKQARQQNDPLPRNAAWDDMLGLRRLAEFLGKRVEPPLSYQRDVGEALDLATWILRAELRQIADGARLDMPERHVKTRRAIEGASTH